jgi:hypothetical protein
MVQRGWGYWSWGLRAAGAGGHPFSEPWGDPFAEGEFLLPMIAAERSWGDLYGVRKNVFPKSRLISQYLLASPAHHA